MKFTYNQFRIILHLLVAFVFLADFLVEQLPTKVYKFLKDNKDTVLGFYYIYLAYEIYNNIVIITPLNTPVGSPVSSPIGLPLDSPLSITIPNNSPRGSYSSQ
jgi:hypothetical protein